VIIGIGTDVVVIARMRALYDRWGDRLVHRILGEQERQVFQARLGRGQAGLSRAVSYLAKRFAAKEAVGKALGCGLSSPMSLHSLQVLNNAAGAPQAVAQKGLASYLAERGLVVHISVSDEQDLAQAFAIVESHPIPSSH
jgi:holo-[acyl-carrier protein] synthase